MGLIKTAIMTGGGIYAVNKLAKTVEHRHSSPQPNQQYNYPPQGQGSWGPPGPPPNGDRSGPQEQRQWYPSNNSQGQQYQQYQQQRGDFPPYNPEDYESEKRRYQQNDDDYQYQSRDGPYNPPPSYAQQQQRPQRQSYDDGYDNGNQSQGRLAALAPLAMQFVQRGDGEGKDSNKKGKGSDLISSFLSK